MKVRAIIVVLLAISLLAAGCVGQKSAYSYSKHNPLQSAFVHQLYGRSAVAAGLQLGGSPFTVDTDLFNVKPALNLLPAAAQTADGRITYLNFTYAPSNTTMPGEDGLYSTGQTWKSKTIYVSSKLSGPDKVPGTIFVKNDDGSYSSYARTDVPAIYAYTLYGTFNTEETVAFGMVNDHGGDLDLNNPSPWVIQEKVNGVWTTVYSPSRYR